MIIPPHRCAGRLSEIWDFAVRPLAEAAQKKSPCGMAEQESALRAGA